MAYVRPQNLHKLDKTKKVALLKEYVAHYEKEVREKGIESLNAKIPREVFAPILSTLGEFLQNHASKLLEENEDVQAFLQANPLPLHMVGLLPDDFRIFALLLNALKQWVSAESAATDRFLLGGTARKTCRAAVSYCIVTGEKLGNDAQLHHPVRDGRPPIFLSKKGHEMVESAVTIPVDESLSGAQNRLWQKLQLLRSQRNQSWKQLREGCEKLLGRRIACRPGAKSFANVVVRETGKTPEEIVQLLDSMRK